MGDSSRDPFYIVRGEVDETLNALQDKYKTWQGTAVGASHRKGLEQELQEDSQGLQYMLTEIDKSIDAAEGNPQRFRLTQAELSSRRKWVLTTRRQLDMVVDGVRAARQAALAGPSSATSKLTAAVREENERFIGAEDGRQQLLMRRQDEELGALSDHVVRIGELGREMGQELHLQGQMLDDLGEEMDGTATRMAAAQMKVQYVLDRAGSKGQLLIIAVLVVALVVLIFLLVA